MQRMSNGNTLGAQLHHVMLDRLDYLNGIMADWLVKGTGMDQVLKTAIKRSDVDNQSWSIDLTPADIAFYLQKADGNLARDADLALSNHVGHYASFMKRHFKELADYPDAIFVDCQKKFIQQVMNNVVTLFNGTKYFAKYHPLLGCIRIKR